MTWEIMWETTLRRKMEGQPEYLEGQVDQI